MSNGEGISNGYDNAVLHMLHRLHLSAAHDPPSSVLIPLRPVLRYMRYLSMGAITVRLPFHSLQVPIALFVFGFLVAFVIWRRRRKYHSAGPVGPAAALMWSTLAALIISHFWVVAANGHMTHTFFNAIVFYIPFLPMAYVAAGYGCAAALSHKHSTETVASTSA